MELNDVKNIRDEIKEVIQSNMFIQFKDHASLMEMDIHEATLQVAQHKLEIVMDQIMEIISGDKCGDCKCDKGKDL